MKNQSRIMKQISFFVEADKLKSVFRQSRLIGENRKENDAEHSWHISLMALILSEYAVQPLDSLRVLKMLLIHDLVEIEAGDILVYDSEGRKNQETKEREAAEKTFGLLPNEQKEELKLLWEEFESQQTAEAKFARAIDRLQPLILNYFSEGQTWLEHKPGLQKVLTVNRIIEDGSPKLWEFAQALIKESAEKGYLE